MGVWRWRVSHGRARAGDVAGYIAHPNHFRRGYRTIKIDRRNYCSNRLVVFYTTGEWPHLSSQPTEGSRMLDVKIQTTEKQARAYFGDENAGCHPTDGLAK
jgi:hypothetical protein